MVSNDTVEAVTAIRDGRWPGDDTSKHEALAQAWLDLWDQMTNVGRSSKADRRPGVEGVK